MVKEADALFEAGFNVTVIYAYWNDWGTQLDKQLLAEKKWSALCIGGDPLNDPVNWTLSRLIYKIARYILQKTGWYKYLADIAVARSSYFFIKEAKKYEADLYIAHNLGALPAAMTAALQNGKPCGFDAEDFHRLEITNDINSFHFKICKYVEDKYLPYVDYMTASSPLIAWHYKLLYNKAVTSIVNVFPKSTAITIIRNMDRPVKLFWFSQTIGPNRGIEVIIESIKLLPGYDFELHLLGNLTVKNRQVFIDKLNVPDINIYFHAPLPPGELIRFAAQFDIGLAAENNIPLNRDICLTNKLFTYMQAGLAIVASNTTSQSALINEYPELGKIYSATDSQSLANVLSDYYNNRNNLYKARKVSLEVGQTHLNWENESEKFLDVIKETLSA